MNSLTFEKLFRVHVDELRRSGYKFTNAFELNDVLELNSDGELNLKVLGILDKSILKHRMIFRDDSSKKSYTSVGEFDDILAHNDDFIDAFKAKMATSHGKMYISRLLSTI